MSIILLNPVLTFIVVFLSQYIFIYLRTINVIYTTERKMMKAILSGTLMSIFWLISVSIGLNSVITGDIIPIIGFLLGGALGTWRGIKQEMKRTWKKTENLEEQ